MPCRNICIKLYSLLKLRYVWRCTGPSFGPSCSISAACVVQPCTTSPVAISCAACYPFEPCKSSSDIIVFTADCTVPAIVVLAAKSSTSLDGATSCYPCPPGYYCPSAGSPAIPCAVGRYTASNGTTSSSCSGACSAPPGNSCNGDGTGTSTIGQPCGLGNYSLGGTGACQLCPAG